MRAPAVPDLRPYQLSGSEWLRPRARAGLFDDTGLGKTATTIHAARASGLRKMLVVAPSIVLFNWAREFGTWWPEARVQVIAEGRARVDLDRHDVVVVTHGLLLRESLFSQLVAVRWDLVVNDEAHHFRGPEALRSIAFYGLRPPPSPLDEAPPPALVEKADRVWILTATPMPNSCAELWTHYRGLWPERLRGAGGRPMSYAEWVKRFCRTRQTLYGPKVIGNRNVAELRELIAGTFLRRLKKNVLPELPRIRYDVVTLRPTRVPWELAQLDGMIRPKALAAAQEQVAEATGDVVGPAWKALREHEDYARWAQLCGLAKAEAVVELLRDELAERAVAKVVVFGWHLAVLDAIAEGLREFGVVVVTGEVSARERQERIDRFQRDDGVRVFVGNIRAAGTGATLTAACEVVFAEMSFVPGDNSQAADRCHRMGQPESVRVRCIALAGTIDEDLTNALRRKTRSVREILK